FKLKRGRSPIWNNAKAETISFLINNANVFYNKSLWKLKVPLHIKIFMRNWQENKNVLLSKASHGRRNKIQDIITKGQMDVNVILSMFILYAVFDVLIYILQFITLATSRDEL
ncbi:hypothetical protein ACJX0J_005617, partial [Zea mays]